jgi:ComF family protein
VVLQASQAVQVMSREAGRAIRGLGAGLLDQLYPPTCLHCDGPVTTADGLCPTCFAALRPITAPLCPRLGIPFEVALGPDALSAEAIADPPPFDRSRSAVLYNAVARKLVSRLKYGDRPELAGFCARLMAVAGTEFWAAEPVLLPVPLHRWRQFFRRYNQSAELARLLAGLTGASHDPLLVRRRKHTRQQVGLTAEARARNVAGAFEAHPEILKRLRGRGVVIVDDVITTGSTVKAVTKALHKAGVERVDVLSFARVTVAGDLS